MQVLESIFFDYCILYFEGIILSFYFHILLRFDQKAYPQIAPDQVYICSAPTLTCVLAQKSCSNKPLVLSNIAQKDMLNEYNATLKAD